MDTSLIVEGGTLGLAAEYAVAAELCRRNIYAQLTLGHQKRTDLLVFSADGEMARVEVKAKQTPEWPACKGIFGKRVFLVLVDLAARALDSRPDFYVLSAEDWRAVVENRIAEIRSRSPEKQIVVDQENVVVFVDEKGKSGKPRRGTNIGVHLVRSYREQWSKILTALRVPSQPTGVQPH